MWFFIYLEFFFSSNCWYFRVQFTRKTLKVTSKFITIIMNKDYIWCVRKVSVSFILGFLRVHNILSVSLSSFLPFIPFLYFFLLILFFYNPYSYFYLYSFWDPFISWTWTLNSNVSRDWRVFQFRLFLCVNQYRRVDNYWFLQSQVVLLTYKWTTSQETWNIYSITQYIISYRIYHLEYYNVHKSILSKSLVGSHFRLSYYNCTSRSPKNVPHYRGKQTRILSLLRIGKVYLRTVSNGCFRTSSFTEFSLSFMPCTL